MRVSPGTPSVGREGPYLLQIVCVMETEPVSGRRVRPMARGCLATEPAQTRRENGQGERRKAELVRRDLCLAPSFGILDSTASELCPLLVSIDKVPYIPFSI